ncbi:MAG: hypothetical protein IK105_00595, partial [Thermoguttaceae bacterium]|nr:hypothetical protein [Thermoguttaceae bacterium]
MKKIKNRSLRLESLEDRMLLAVTAGGEAAAAELVAPAETGAEVVINQLSFNALRSAIVKAQDGDTIVFADGLEGTIDATSYINIGKNVTIDGGGKITIRGAGENNLLNITKSCTLTGLTFENGYSSTAHLGGIGAVGGGISVTLNNCNIIGNTGESDGGFGGAFYVTGQLYMNNCTVYGNSAIYGGFAYLYGRENHGAALIDATNCTFYGNTSIGYGSVIGNAGGTVNLTNCTVVGNTTTEGAGAIASYEFFTVGGTDGAWTHEFMIGDTTITNSIIAYNKATDQATADIYTDYTKQLYGNGALQWDVFGMDDTFTKIAAVNSAIGVKGDYFVAAPTFDAEGNLDVDALDLTIKSDGIAAFAGIGANTVEYTGAGYTDADLVVTTLSDTIDSTDGEVSLREAIAYATLGTFEGAPTITFADGLADGTIVLANGQLAVTSDMRIVGDNITIDANEADRALFLKSNNYQFAIAGNYYNFENIPACPVHNFTDYCINVMVDGVNFTGGAATAISKASGGAGILVQQNANLVLRNSTVSDNTLYLTDDSFSVGEAHITSIGGGGIAGILYAALALDNVTVVDNAVVQTGDRSTDIILQGGGIYIGIRSNIQMTDSTVSRNELTSQSYLNGNHSDWCFGYGRGAGIALFGELATISASEISANTITACAIEQYGGGIYYFNLSDSVFGGYGLIVTNSKITDNKVGDHNVENNGFCGGAGLYTSGKTLLVNDLIAGNAFDAGNASVNMTGYIYGAGICNATVKEYYSRAMNAASIDAYYCTVTNNTAACIDYAGYNTDSGSWGGGIASLGNGNEYGAATVNFVGGILYHNYSKNSGTEATTNNDSYNGDNSTFNMYDTLYNTSGSKGSGYEYENCIRWLARYKVFKDEANQDYTLWDGANPSQALDILSDTAPVPPAEYTSAYDVRNEPYVRVYGTAQDLGCYENQPEPAPTFELELTAYTGVYDAAAHSITVSGVEAGD